MKNSELQEILKKHELWLDGEEGGERANLCGANLRGANLCGANLRGAYLSGANLSDATLSYAILSYANLSDATLSGANLCGANLSDANLSGASLSYANLSGASLRGAYLSGANLNSCSGNRSEIKSILSADAYPIAYTSEYLQIGCERHLIADWREFDNRRILEMDGRSAVKFWEKWKGLIFSIIDASPAKPTSASEEQCK